MYQYQGRKVSGAEVPENESSKGRKFPRMKELLFSGTKVLGYKSSKNRQGLTVLVLEHSWQIPGGVKKKLSATVSSPN